MFSIGTVRGMLAAMTLLNHQFRLAARPAGLPKHSDWAATSEPVTEPKDGELVVRMIYLSLDPAMRGWMNDQRSYVPPVAIGEVMRAGALGQVITSKHPKFAVGDHVVGHFGVQEYARSTGDGVFKVPAHGAALPVYLGALGMTGMTAYFGLLDVGKPQAGDTVVVSGAAGATGSVAGQIAKLKGCRVVGIAGGPDKCKTVVQDFGFDACVDYKSGDLKKALREACPSGVNVYFDNVGGDVLDAVLTRLAPKARVVICGAISQYNATAAPKGPANYLSLLVNRAKMEGFVVFDYAPRYKEAAAELGAWVAAGQLKTRETIVDGGIAAFPDTFTRLFSGDSVGKLLLRIGPERS
jgi:hypothetical protein